MTGVLDAAALAVTAAGVLALLAGPAQGWHAALALALDFWIGAGLLRLSASTSWSALAVAAAVVAVRTLVQVGRMRRSATIRG
jgi:hypothetical protein